LLFGWLYLWTVAPQWQPPEQSAVGVWPLFALAGVLGAGSGLMQRCVAQLRAGQTQGLAWLLLAASACAVLACAGLATLLVSAGLQPRQTAHDAVLSFTLLFLLA